MPKNTFLTVLLLLAVMITVHSIVKAENTPPNHAGAEYRPAAAATVTAVGMNPKNYHVIFDAETATGAVATIGAVVTVTGSSLELLKPEDIIITAVPTGCGITVSNPATKTAVTASAAAVTFEAVINVPYNTPERQYALTASTSAIVNGGFNDEIAMVYVSYVYDVPPEPIPPRLKMKTAPITMGLTEKADVAVNTRPIDCSISVSSANPKIVKANYSFNKISLKALKTGKSKIRATAYHDGYDDLKSIYVRVKKRPDSILLKNGRKAAKNTINMRIAKNKKPITKKSYKIILPKNAASYGYSIKISGKKTVVKKAKTATNQKGEQKLIITLKKKAHGSAKVTIVPRSNKNIRAMVKIKPAG